MAKKVNEVQNGDIKSNIVVLRSVFGKVGQKYYIQPQKMQEVDMQIVLDVLIRKVILF